MSYIDSSLGIKLLEVDSTNNYIKDQSIPSGAWVISENQTAGKGRKDHKWESLGNENIYFSTKILYPISVSIPIVSLFTASSIIRALDEVVTENNLLIKWPNDIFMGLKKVGGILIESEVKGNEILLIIGIGINIYTKDKPEDLPYAGFLFSLEPDKSIKQKIVLSIIENLNLMFEKIKNENLIELELKYILEKSYLKDKKIQLEWKGNLVIGDFSGYDSNGFLKVKLESEIITLMDTDPSFRIL
ncbi:MAG: biotin--[acetyl-CoA-carboxylase] ligase [Leptospiraceae bacterium]|nr:biotin--[acetyl-CoA-carboxylase] ligase [Leptospiraceae bacterium]